MTENKIVAYRDEVKAVMADKEVFNTLAKNTFEGLEATNVPQALLQGLMKGFSLEDFMVGNVYAIPFWNKKKGVQDFSLITSIDHMRKVAMRSGQSGKSKPLYEFKDDGENVLSCEVTVYKHDGDERGYTALVFFKEYDTKKNLWTSKPMTMIAKVAEAHALRMAFPEEMSNMYSAEEMEKEKAVEAEVVVEVDSELVDEAIKKMNSYRKVDSLEQYFLGLEKNLKIHKNVINAYNERKQKLQNTKDGTEK